MRPSKIRRHLAVVEERHGGDLEKACIACGACCQTKVQGDGAPVIIKSLPCKYLEWDGNGTSRCSVYDRRHELAPWCKDLTVAIQQSIFPNDCPYVDGLRGYRGAVVVDGPKYEALVEGLRASLRSEPCPPWAKPELWQAFVNGRS